MANVPMTEPRYSKRIPLLLLLPVAAAVIVWLLPAGQIRMQERRSGELPVPAGARAIRLELGVGIVKVLGGESGKVTFEARSLRAAQDEAAFQVLMAQDLTLTGSLDPATGDFVLRTPPFPEGLEVQYEARTKEGEKIPRTGSRGFREFDVRVQVPADLPLRVHSQLGDVDVDDMSAPVTVQTGLGNVRMKSPMSKARIHTSSGDVIVDRHRAALDVTADKGDLLINLIEVLAPVKLLGRDGTIRVAVPGHASFDLDVRVYKGGVITGFKLPRLPFGQGGTRLQGKIGDGGPPVDIEVSNKAVDAKGQVSVLVE